MVKYINKDNVNVAANTLRTYNIAIKRIHKLLKKDNINYKKDFESIKKVLLDIPLSSQVNVLNSICVYLKSIKENYDNYKEYKIKLKKK